MAVGKKMGIWVAATLLCACGTGDGAADGASASDGASDSEGSGDGSDSSGTGGAQGSTASVAESSTGGEEPPPGDSSDGASGDATGRPAPCPTEPQLDVVFAERPGIDPSLLSLDVYPAPGDGPAPAVVFVHGGGWVIGDKSGIATAPFALDFFADEGFSVVSTNYRLITDPGSPNATWDDQPTDVAAAVAWVSEHADELCIDAERIVLIGHSAGAHIVALVGSDGSYLEAEGLGLSSLSDVVSLDVNAYDIPWAIDNAASHGLPSSSMSLQQIFTMDRAQHVAASPISHLDATQNHPSFLVVWAPVFQGIEQTLSQAASERFVDALLDIGADAAVVGSLDDDHGTLAARLGMPGHPPTEAIRTLLDEG